jgi:hypothetical protein
MDLSVSHLWQFNYEMNNMAQGAGRKAQEKS